MDLNKLKFFYEVVLKGTYELAGKTLNRSAVAVGQNVRDLEKSLGHMLFRRTYRGLTLTKEGQVLFEGAARIFKEDKLLEQTLKLNKQELNCIKILATAGITSDWISRFVPSFLKKHPTLTLEISSLTSMAAFDLYEYDVYMGEILKKDPKYVYKFIKGFRYNFYASAEYIERHGYPKGVEDLKNHRLIEFNIRRVSGFYKSTDFFEFINANERQRVSIDSTLGEYQLVKGGVGIGCLCEELSFLKGSNLIPLLTNIEPMIVDVFFVFHEAFRDNKILLSLLKEVKLHA
jgi:DNA-binding transcriptional LysR family regulator